MLLKELTGKYPMIDTAELRAEKDAVAVVKRRLHLDATLLALIVLGSISTGLYFWGRDLHRFTQWLAAYIFIYVVHLAVYAFACWFVTRRNNSSNSRRLLAALVVVLFAMAFRFTLVTQRPFLSADVYRYVWDAKVQAAGINPYRYVPGSPELSPLQDRDLYSQIPAEDREWTSPYPPLAQIVFRVSALVGKSSVTAMKITMSLFDLLSMLALMYVLRRGGQDPAGVIVFAWHPLLVFESAHSGHIDSVYLALIAVALMMWTLGKSRRNSLSTGAMVGGAMLVKFYPGLLLPAFLGGDTSSGGWFERVRRAVFSKATAYMIAGALAIAVLLWWPFASEGTRILQFFGDYIRDEGFAGTGSRYFGLELLRLASPVPTSVFVIAAGAAMLWAVLYAVIRIKRNAADVAAGCLIIAATYLLLTTPRYAWYYALLLPLLCLSQRACWLLLASAAPLLYLLWYTPLVYPNIPVWLGGPIYIPPVLWLLRDAVRARQSSSTQSNAIRR